MVVKATALWFFGLFTFVPYGVYYLFYQADKSEYALVITLILFWPFGYWGVVGPLLAALKVRQVMRAIERVQTKEDLLQTLASNDAREVAIEIIANDNHIPRFLAARVYNLLIRGLTAKEFVGKDSEKQRDTAHAD
jgi:hypothetical protein